MFVFRATNIQNRIGISFIKGRRVTDSFSGYCSAATIDSATIFLYRTTLKNDSVTSFIR